MSLSFFMDVASNKDPELLTTGDMARRSQSTLRTVRFYEEAGLLHPSDRRDGGHRLFEERELHKLCFILDLREAGLSLADIRSLFALKTAARTAAEATERISEHLERRVVEMQRKITTLRSLREELASTVAILADCVSCKDGRFPEFCGRCDVLGRQDLPRAVRLLWTR
jgi:DNA-binding transcriptional MerR regulator